MQELISELVKASDKPLTRSQLTELISNNNFHPEEILAKIKKQWHEENITGHAHQLGFFKLKLAVVDGTFPRTIRLHYWNRAEVQDDIHDHISSFASRVIYGSLRNELYESNDGDQNYILKKFKSTGDCCTPSSHHPVKMQSLRILSNETLEEGQSYFLKYDQLHRLTPISDELITLIVQDAPADREINVYRRANNELARSESATPIPKSKSLKIFSRLEKLLG